MNLQQAIKRIEELERKVAELEAIKQAPAVNHYHYHPQPLYQLPMPQRFDPWCGIVTTPISVGIPAS